MRKFKDPVATRNAFYLPEHEYTKEDLEFMANQSKTMPCYENENKNRKSFKEFLVYIFKD